MEQLRVLVFSAAYGNGHFRAAEAIIEGILIEEPSAAITHLDFADFLNKPVNTIIKSVYGEIIKHVPKLWGEMYYKTSQVQPKSFSQHLLSRLGRSRFLNYIQELKPAFIVCTYPTVSDILAQLRIEQRLQIPVITVITDYTVHSHWVHPGVDRYLVACEEVKKSLLTWGIKAEAIFVSGIPVSPKFERSVDRGLILAKLGLKTDLPTFLVMGGSYGVLKSAERICKKLADSLIPVQVMIVCGKNEKLYHSLEKFSLGARNPIVRFKYVHNVEELMSVSHLIITKAGGLTVSEALTKHLPLIIFKPIPGQEEENTHFVQRSGAGLVAETEFELGRLLNHLLSNPYELETMRKNAAGALPGHSTERAVRDILQLARVYKEEAKN